MLRKLNLLFLGVVLFTLMVYAKSSVVWSGAFDANNWNSCQEVSIGSVSSGDKIVFKGDAYSNAQIQICSKDWQTKFTGDYASFDGTYTIDVTSSNASTLSQGVNVKGQNFKLTSVTVISGGDDSGNTGGSTSGDSGNSGSSSNYSGKGFHTSGTKLLDANGNEFIMRGVNYSWCWQYGNGDGNTADDVIPAAKRQGANVIRIQLADGGNRSWKKPTAAELSNLIKLCKDNKLIAIFNTHDETGSNKESDLERAANFWISMKDILNANRAYVLINISNEWYGNWEASSWAAGYEKVIPMLRNAGIKNTLIVDCAGYGQYPASIPEAGAGVLASDPDKNMIFSEHLYDCFPTAAKVDAAIDNALTVGAPVIVGEFSYNHKGQSVAWQEILDHCQAKSVGYLGWSWTGNGDGTEACDMFGGYDDSDMKENGKCIILGHNGIKETSKECSLFSGIKGGGTTDPDANYLPWTGSATAGDGKIFSAAGFAVGDTIQFKGSGSGTLTIQTKAGKTIASGSFNGDYRLAITDANFSALTSTWKLAGSGYTITAMNKKRYVKGGNDPIVPVENGYRVTVWEGSFPIEWSGNGLKLLGYRFDGAQKGDKLIFTISDPVYSGKKGPQLQIGNSGYSAMVEGKEGQGCVDIKKGKTTYEFTLNAENVDDLLNGEQDGGLRIKGQNCTLTSVVLETASPQYEYTTKAVFSPKGGGLDMGMWSDDALTKIQPAKFKAAGLQEGDRVVFNLTETNATEMAQLQIVYLKGWEAIRSNFKNVGVQAPRFWFTVTADEAAQLNSVGMGLKGTKCILKSVEVWHRNDVITGIDNITADDSRFDDNTPVEIYTLSGQRIYHFDNSRRQMYIIKQGGKTMKVIR
ncbi:cellulase family glycosylhydrolase [Prevotella sp. AGR2160]|uniref:cellulase family glycosylhydrolase n=1 Tax=Prevotella sp. AGR2160 TaxID=1280674 RepID=UPI0009DBDBC5|nr:cellulase family glycosylhydrolase [Prevotella sp. AGR2160]